MPSTSSVALTGNPDIDGVLSGVKWATTSLSFGFTSSFSPYSYASSQGLTGFEAMNATQQSAVRAILHMYEGYTNLSFTELTGTAADGATLRFAEEDDAGTAYAYYPSSGDWGGDAWFNHTSYNTPLKGTYAYASFMHEIGHALGLDHGQDGVAALPTNHDSLEYSVMTYRSYVGAGLTGYTAAQGSYPQTLMMDDIAALQYMYGANYTTNSGDTVYRWSTSTGEMSINGVGQGASTTNTIFATLWDGGGNDTYDFSNYSTNLTVDLRPGEWTTTSSSQLASLGFQGQVARGNIANAYLNNGNLASLIENAIGGSGNDTITGNQANNRLDGGSGNDTLTGGLGNDVIIGGIGTDVCVVGVDYANCTITYDGSLLQFTLVSADGTDIASGIEWFRFLGGATYAAVSFMGPDVSAPTLVSSTPADGSGGVNRAANLVLTFSETVHAGAGTIVIHNADGSVAMSIDVTDGTQAAFAGSTLTVNPSADLLAGSSYYVTLDAGAVLDGANNSYAGFSSNTALNFTTLSNTISGSSSNNSLTGTDGADIINGNGGNDKLYGLGDDDMLNGGSGRDTMTGGAGNDTYVVDSTYDKVVETLNEGTDTVRSSIKLTLGANVENLVLTGSSGLSGTGNGLDNRIEGNEGANTLSGLDGQDSLYGMGGKDTLSGGNGDDVLSGGTGADKLTGGAGADQFVFDTTLGSSNIDKITDFSIVDDTLVLDNAIFAALADGSLDPSRFAIGSSAPTSDVHIYYNSATGALFYDDDGNGAHAAQQFATLGTGLGLTASDFLIV